jgi:hypothetical protein
MCAGTISAKMGLLQHGPACKCTISEIIKKQNPILHSMKSLCAIEKGIACRAGAGAALSLTQLFKHPKTISVRPYR